MKYLYEELLPKELDKLMKKNPVVFVPIGLLEWHGLHLPIGNDGLKSYELCKRVAKKVNGVILPPTYWGIHGIDFIKNNTRKHDGTLRVKVNTFKSLIRNIYETLIYQGFKTIVLLTGHYHPEQVRIVKQIANEMMKKNESIRIIAIAEYDVYPNHECRDHAAKWETSILWELRPDLVKINRLDNKLLGLESWEHPENIDPRKSASRKLGKQIVKIIVDGIIKLIETSKLDKNFKNDLLT